MEIYCGIKCNESLFASRIEGLSSGDCLLASKKESNTKVRRHCDILRQIVVPVVPPDGSICP